MIIDGVVCMYEYTGGWVGHGNKLIVFNQHRSSQEGQSAIDDSTKTKMQTLHANDVTHNQSNNDYATNQRATFIETII